MFGSRQVRELVNIEVDSQTQVGAGPASPPLPRQEECGVSEGRPSRSCFSGFGAQTIVDTVERVVAASLASMDLSKLAGV